MAKRQVLTRILGEVGELMVQTRPLIERLQGHSDRVIQSSCLRLLAMHGVIKALMGQIVHWLSTGQVAANKIVHVASLKRVASFGTRPASQTSSAWLI